MSQPQPATPILVLNISQLSEKLFLLKFEFVCEAVIFDKDNENNTTVYQKHLYFTIWH